MARAFITGAQGFIARALTDRLRAGGWEVNGVDLRADPAAGIVQGDTTQAGDWQRAAHGAELVIHTAAVVSNVAALDRSWRVNVLGTRHALDAARDGGARRFVHLSSIRAFSDLGFPADVQESWPVRPDGNPYVDTKIASEQVVLQAHAAGELPVTVIRPGDVYGPGSRPWTLLPLEAIKQQRLLLPAFGRGLMSPVYVDDLVDGILLAVDDDGASGQVFTLTGGVGVPCREFFGHYYRMLARRGPPVAPSALAGALAALIGPVDRARGRESEANRSTMRYLSRRHTYSIAKARTLLGYQPRFDLEHGMRATEAWLRAQHLV
jgi:nucleoside-diphosphate-sugar epimerase